MQHENCTEQQVLELSCKIEIENLYYRIMPAAKRIKNKSKKIERTESQICIFRPTKRNEHWYFPWSYAVMLILP